jgi:nicotinate-nucleotide pyrophosphorylase (carboxylating)
MNLKSIYLISVDAFFYGKDMNIEQLIELSLSEDIRHGDITTDFLDLKNKKIKAVLKAKEAGVLAGLEVSFQVFNAIDEKTKCKSLKKDGDFLNKGEIFAEISGYSSSVLKAERVSLNFLQRLSGIATLTNKYVQKIYPYKAWLLDTRKTTPLLRELEKYAVRIGGGFNHRFGLYDMIMLKENHIKSAGSITEAVKRVKAKNTSYKIEVEVTNSRELDEAVKAGADRVMLDNMGVPEMQKAVEEYSGKVELEASGNVKLDTIEEIAKTGVDFISCGALTHSYKSLDISLLFID